MITVGGAPKIWKKNVGGKSKEGNGSEKLKEMWKITSKKVGKEEVEEEEPKVMKFLQW